MLIRAATCASAARRTIRALARDRRGATAIEYSIIAAIMTLAVFAAFGVIQAPLTAIFQAIADKFSAL